MKKKLYSKLLMLSALGCMGVVGLVGVASNANHDAVMSAKADEEQKVEVDFTSVSKKSSGTISDRVATAPATIQLNCPATGTSPVAHPNNYVKGDIPLRIFDVNAGVFVDDPDVRMGVCTANESFVVSIYELAKFTNNHSYQIIFKKGDSLGGNAVVARDRVVQFRYYNNGTTAFTINSNFEPDFVGEGTFDAVHAASLSVNNIADCGTEGQFFINFDGVSLPEDATENAHYESFANGKNLHKYNLFNKVKFSTDGVQWDSAMDVIKTTGNTFFKAGGQYLRFAMQPKNGNWTYLPNYNYVKVEAGAQFPRYEYISGASTENPAVEIDHDVLIVKDPSKAWHTQHFNSETAAKKTFSTITWNNIDYVGRHAAATSPTDGYVLLLTYNDAFPVSNSCWIVPNGNDVYNHFKFNGKKFSEISGAEIGFYSTHMYVYVPNVELGTFDLPTISIDDNTYVDYMDCKLEGITLVNNGGLKDQGTWMLSSAYNSKFDTATPIAFSGFKNNYNNWQNDTYGVTTGENGTLIQFASNICSGVTKDGNNRINLAKTNELGSHVYLNGVPFKNIEGAIFAPFDGDSIFIYAPGYAKIGNKIHIDANTKYFGNLLGEVDIVSTQGEVTNTWKKVSDVTNFDPNYGANPTLCDFGGDLATFTGAWTESAHTATAFYNLGADRKVDITFDWKVSGTGGSNSIKVTTTYDGNIFQDAWIYRNSDGKIRLAEVNTNEPKDVWTDAVAAIDDVITVRYVRVYDENMEGFTSDIYINGFKSSNGGFHSTIKTANLEKSGKMVCWIRDAGVGRIRSTYNTDSAKKYNIEVLKDGVKVGNVEVNGGTTWGDVTGMPAFTALVTGGGTIKSYLNEYGLNVNGSLPVGRSAKINVITRPSANFTKVNDYNNNKVVTGDETLSITYLEFDKKPSAAAHSSNVLSAGEKINGVSLNTIANASMDVLDNSGNFVRVFIPFSAEATTTAYPYTIFEMGDRDAFYDVDLKGFKLYLDPTTNKWVPFTTIRTVVLDGTTIYIPDGLTLPSSYMLELGTHCTYDYKDGNNKVVDLSKPITADIVATSVATEHDFNFVAKVDATVDANGMEAHYECEECGKYFTKSGEVYTEVAAASLVIAKTLPAYKTNAKADLDAYKNADDYRANEKTALANAIADGKTAIDAAENKAGVDAAVANAKAVIDAIKTEASYIAEELAAAKEQACADLDTYRATKSDADYREAQVTALNDAVTAGNTAINACTVIDDVAVALVNAKAALDAIKTDATLTAEELAAAKAEAKATIAAIDTSEYTIFKFTIDDGETYITLAEYYEYLMTAIDGAIDVAEVNKYVNYSSAAKDICEKDAVILAARETATAQVNTILDNYTHYDFKDLPAQLLANIAKATSSDEANYYVSYLQSVIVNNELVSDTQFAAYNDALIEGLMEEEVAYTDEFKAKLTDVYTNLVLNTHIVSLMEHYNDLLDIVTQFNKLAAMNLYVQVKGQFSVEEQAKIEAAITPIVNQITANTSEAEFAAIAQAIYDVLVGADSNAELLIANLPEVVTLDDEAAIVAARAAVDAVPEDYEGIVENVAVLEAAEAQLATLKAAKALADHKAAKVEELEDAYAALNLEKYSEDNKKVLESIVEEYKKVINEAETAEEVDAAVTAALAALAAVEEAKVGGVAGFLEGCMGSAVAASGIIALVTLLGAGLAVGKKRKED